MKTVTAKTKAWIHQYSSYAPGSDMNDQQVINNLSFSNQDMKTGGWTYAGEAEITVTLVDEKTLVDNKVEALREEAKAIRAEATAKVTRIEGQIQSLLAISCDAELIPA